MLLGDERREAEEFVNSVTHWLLEAGFLLTSHQTGLNLGGQIWRFTSPHIDIEFVYEARDGLVVTAGAVGKTTFTYHPWVVLMNFSYRQIADVDGQWRFFQSNIELLREYAVNNQEKLTEQLEKINLMIVIERLGLPYDSE